MTKLKKLTDIKIWKSSYQLLKKNFSFCMNIFFLHILNFFSNNSPVFILGIYLKPVAIGIYYIANQIISVPISLLTKSLSRVFFPSLSRLKITEIRERILEYTEMSVVIIWPIFISFAFIIDKLIIFFFTEKWVEAIPIARTLLIYAGFNILINPISSIPIILKRPDLELKWNFLSIIIKGICLLVSAKYGLAIAILSFSLANVVLYLIFQYIITYLLKIDFLDYILNYLFYLIYFIPYSAILLLLKNLKINSIIFISSVISLNFILYIILNYQLKGRLLIIIKRYINIKK